MRDLAPIIAAMLIETGCLPGRGPADAVTLARKIWPQATTEQAVRGYYIAVEIYEDDYLFEAA